MMLTNFGLFGGFGVFPVLFGIVFILFLVIFLMAIIKGLTQWNKNNHSPRLTVDATVVAKRMDVSHHHHHHGGDHTHVHTTHSTSYYVTFEVESGDRMELHVPGTEYGLLIEGDHGRLTFQGTRYLGFERM